MQGSMWSYVRCATRLCGIGASQGAPGAPVHMVGSNLCAPVVLVHMVPLVLTVKGLHPHMAPYNLDRIKICLQIQNNMEHGTHKKINKQKNQGRFYNKTKKMKLYPRLHGEPRHFF